MLMLAALTGGCNPHQAPDPPVPRQSDAVTAAKDFYGTFYSFSPTQINSKTEILVLIHGTPSAEQAAEQSAQDLIAAWQDFAAINGWILIAPAFNQEDFSSRLGDHALGGYRGLFGRQIMADAWVLRLVQADQKAYHLSERQFYLFGHSAGGQFTARFLVTHPDLVKRAAITTAATYPQPDPGVAWPFGMGELDAEIEWDEVTRTHVQTHRA
jgi:poly(3-hydroxybutyrate) depolymerase